MNIEAILPFQVLAIIIGWFGARRSVTWHWLMVGLVIALLQPLIVIRAWDKDRSGRLAYILTSELYSILTVAGIVFGTGWLVTGRIGNVT